MNNLRFLIRKNWLLLTLFCLGVCSFSLKQIIYLKADTVPQFKTTKVLSQCNQIDILKIVKMNWNEPLKLDLAQVVHHQNTGFNAVDYSQVPGPKNYSVRPNLIPYTNLGGIVGRIEDGTGRKLSKLVFFTEKPQVISLPTEPYQLGARSDGGAWVLFQKNLVHYNIRGIPQLSVRNPGGTRLVVTKENDVWILSLSHAWFVSSTGHIRGSWQWNGFLASVTMGKSLCKLERISQHQIIKCLKPDGKENFTNLSWLKRKPSGFLLGISNDAILTGDRYRLNRYKKDGRSDSLILENAGLTAQGDAYISLYANQNWADVCISNGESRNVFIKYVNPSFKFPPPKMTIAAIENEKNLTYGYDRAIWFSNSGQVERHLTINDWSYREEIFPHLWNTNGLYETAVQGSDETVVLSSSGPTGITLIKLRWKS